MALVKVERMTGNPPACLACGAGNIPDEHGDVGPFIDLCIPINWGEDGYLCPMCIQQIAALMGYISVDQQEELRSVLRHKDQELHTMKSKYDMLLAKYNKVSEDLMAVGVSRRIIKENKAREEKVGNVGS